MKTRTLHKALSMLLTAAMVLNMGLTPVFASEGTTPPGISSVCTHHTEHTENCGYKQGTPCAHEHTDDCGYTEVTEERPCTFIPDQDGEASPANATEHTHDDTCGYTPAAEGTPCKHEHDETCGYTADSPCTFDVASCTQCNPGDKPTEKVCTCEPTIGASDAGHDEDCPLYTKPVCTCPPVDSGELVHGKDCPLYTAPELSEEVKAIIAMAEVLEKWYDDLVATGDVEHPVVDENGAILDEEQRARFLEDYGALLSRAEKSDALKILSENKSFVRLTSLYQGMQAGTTMEQTMAMARAADVPPIDAQSILVSSGEGQKLLAGQTYTVNSNVTINSDRSSLHGLTVEVGADVNLIVNSGCTLTVYGKDGEATIAGGAGIHLPQGATLKVSGEGSIDATGGNGGNGGNGEDGRIGGNSNAGRGGNGGGGPGAAIGGSSGADEADGEAMGTLYLLDTVSVTAAAGKQGLGGNGGGTYGGGGGGGGGGGAGGNAAIIGGGAGGGGDGGSGGSSLLLSDIAKYGGGGGGGGYFGKGGKSNSSKGADSIDAAGGEGGRGSLGNSLENGRVGISAGRGGNGGTLYIVATASVNGNKGTDVKTGGTSTYEGKGAAVLLPGSDVCKLEVFNKSQELISTQNYASLEAAAKAVSTNVTDVHATITLLSDVVINETIKFNFQNVTFVAKGHRTITRGVGLTGNAFHSIGGASSWNNELHFGSPEGMGDGNSLTLDGNRVAADSPFIYIKYSGLLTINDGVTIKNCVNSSNIAAIHCDKSTVTVNGGQIIDNSGDNKNYGAGIHCNAGTLNLFGGKITGNIGSGIGFQSADTTTVNIKGNPIVTDNFIPKSTQQRNLFLKSVAKITGEITTGADIGVTKGNPTVGAPEPFAIAGSKYELTDSDLSAFHTDYSHVYTDWNADRTGFHIAAYNTLTADSKLSASGVLGTTLRDLTFQNITVKDSTSKEVAGSWSFAQSDAATVFPALGGTTRYTATFMPTLSADCYTPLTVALVPTMNYFTTDKQATAAPSPNSGGWNNSDITLTAPTGFTLSTSNSPSGTWSSTLALSTEGTHTQNYFFKQTTNGHIAQGTFTYKLDKTAPMLSNAVAPAGENLTNTTAKITFTADDVGNFCYVLQPDTAPVPSVAQILAATENSAAMTADEANTILLTGLSPSTAYKVYIAAKDKADNPTGVATAISFTTSKPTLIGTLVANSNRTYGDQITLSVVGGQEGLSYTYKCGAVTNTDGVFDIDKNLMVSGGVTFTVTADNDTNGLQLKVNDFQKRTLNVTAKADDKVYDGSTTASGSFTVSNKAFSDQVTVGGTFAFKDENAGMNKPIDIGAFSISSTDSSHSYYEASPPTSVTASITGSATQFTGGIKTLKGSNTQTTFIYGDIITVKVTPTATGSKSRIAEPGGNQVALFLGNTQLTDPQNVTNGAEVTFAIDTKKKELAIGENTITAKYVGNTNMAGHEESVTITLSPKQLTATIPASAGKPYDGNEYFYNVALILSGVETDDVNHTYGYADGAVDDVNVGENKTFTVTSAFASSLARGYYSLAAADVTGTVSITAATPTVSVTAAAKPKSPLRTIIGDHNDTIILTATVTGVKGEKPSGSVVFKNGNTTLATKSVSNGVATFDWANPTAGDNITITAEFTASDSNYISTPVTDTYEFGISKADQKDFAITAVGKKTYGDSAFTLSTTGGSTGDVRYTSNNNSILTISGSAATIKGAGYMTITATKNGDANFNEATVTMDVHVAEATPTISWGANAAQTVTYTGTAAAITPPTVTLVNSESYGDKEITYTYTEKAKLSNFFGLFAEKSTTLPSNAGVYEVTAHTAAFGNYKAADSGEMTLTIEKSTPSLTINGGNTKTYDGTAIANPTKDQMVITGAAYEDVTFTYSKNYDMSDPLSAAPKNRGTYYVQASVAASGNANAATSASVSFTIAQVKLSVIGGKVVPKQWDGNTNASVNELTFSGVANGETLENDKDYSVKSANYNNSNVGNNKTVTGSVALIYNSKMDNYTLQNKYDYTINGDIILADGPNAPTNGVVNDENGIDSFGFTIVDSITDVTKYEYSLNSGTDWKDVTTNPISIGNIAVPVGALQVRVKETATHKAGEILSNTVAFTATLEGSVSIDGTATYGETLTAKPTGTQTGAVFSYEWKSGGAVLQAKSASNTYKIAGTAVGKAITVEVTAASYNGSLTASTSAVAKKGVTVAAGIISKVYDGTTAVETADQALIITKVNVSDDITVTMPSATYSSKNTGAGTPITVGDLSITGAAKDWYTVTAPSSVTGEIAFKALTVSDGTLAIAREYNTTTAFTASTGTLSLTGVVGSEAVGVKIDSYGNAADANVGTKTLSLGISLDGADKHNYTLTSPYSFTKASITAKAITPTIEAIPAVTYDGTAQQPTITVKDGSTTLAASDYTVAYSDNTNAGTGKVAVTLKGNYRGSVNATFNINKAAAPTVAAPANIPMVKGSAKPYTFDLSTLAMSQNAGGATYAVASPSDASLFTANPTVNADGKTLNFTSANIATAGGTSTVVVTITSANYEDATVTLTFEITNQIPVAISGISVADRAYNGTAVTYTGTPMAKDDKATVTVSGYDYSWSTAAGAALSEAPKNAGDYKLTVSVKTSDTQYIGSVDVLFTIRKATVEIAVALSEPQIVEGSTLPSASIRYDGLVSGESLTPATTATFSGMPSSSTKGTYTITWSNKAAMQAEIEALPAYKNYTASYKDSVTLQISGKSSGGSDSGGNGGDTTPPSLADTAPPTQGEVKVKPKVDANNNATVTVNEKDIINAIKKGQDEAKKNGTEKNGIAVTITLDTDKTINSFTANLPKVTQEKLIDAGVPSLTINGRATITFDLEAIKQIKITANADVTVTATSSLSKEAQAATNGRPVYDFKVTGGGKSITTFGSGKLALSIPYELQKVDANGKPSKTGSIENPGNLVGVYVNANGKLTYLRGSSYNAESKTMLINANHLSVYGVAYKTNVPTFTDTASHWAKDDIQFVAARGLLTRTTATTFAPNGNMTRGMFVTALGRLVNTDVSGYKTSSFNDIAGDSYYLGYVEWAVKNNIVKGVGDGKFAPEQSISRQEMAVMLQGYTKATGYKLPSVHKEIVFTDSASISAWAKSAVKEMQMAGILVGKDGGKFDPTGTATRAEVSAMLRRFVELVANSETAEGWVTNDSGNWMYFENGKAVTGKKKIGGTNYKFDQYGVTALLPKDRRYILYTVKKGDSFWAIASKYRVNIFELVSLNGKTIFSTIHPGDEVKIPQA